MENMNEVNVNELEGVTGGAGSKTNDKPGSPTPLAPKSGCQNYRIAHGDNLTRIANRCNVTVNELMRINSGIITNKNYIREGFYMYIPA